MLCDVKAKGGREMKGKWTRENVKWRDEWIDV
jgi:hypothetical protein